MLPMYARRPLSRLETALYTLIIGIAVAFFLDRLLELMELAERSAMEQTVLRVNSVLMVQIASEMLKGQLIHVDAALKKNAFELTKTVPPNYRGEGDAFALARLEGGSWFFDRDHAELVYKPRLKRNLTTADGTGVVRFHLAAAPGTRYVLVPAYNYTWE